MMVRKIVSGVLRRPPRVAPKALEIPDESPCELCPMAATCRAGDLACAQFASFVNYGGRRWRSEPRVPTAAIFAGI